MIQRSLFILGVFVHILLFYSIFDVYYTSPLVRGTRPHPITTGDAPAKRVVIFSADGLRSRAFYGHPEQSPFLHDIIRGPLGVWGISKSHVPTESRPGHVAMMAGFYEDVSAVTRGWKHNPVEFDSIFNESKRSFLWGSPDIVPMFADGLDHVYADAYTSEEEDFSSENASSLDLWVFEKVENFLKNESLDGDRMIFFLHLLGLDTNGHGHKPDSKEYIDNIGVVDAGIARMADLFVEKFPDNRTAFIFTADHGMTDWGSHGSGTDDEILTPVVAWGAGIKSLTTKQTINQVDVAPLVAALLGIAVPMNSVGVLPLTFLDVSPQMELQAACGNLKQMVDQYNVRRAERVKHALPLTFRDYPGFAASVLNKVNSQVSDLRAKRRHQHAANFCLQWVPLVRDALIYFHRYQRFSLGIAIAGLFGAWNSLLYAVFSRSPALRPLDNTVYRPRMAFVIMLIVAFFLIWYQRLPFTNYLYYMLPVYLLAVVVNVAAESSFKKPDAVEQWPEIVRSNWKRWGLNAGGFVLPLVVLVAAFFERTVVSGLLLFLAAQPAIQGNRLVSWSRIWAGTCFVLAVFPFLETVGRTPSPGFVIMAPISGVVLLEVFKRKLGPDCDQKIFFVGLQFALVGSSVVNGVTTGLGYAPALVKVLSWLSLPLSVLAPLTVRSHVIERVVAWLGALFVPYSVLALAYESFFVVVLALLLVVYVRLEHSHLSDDEFFRLSTVTSTSTTNPHGRFTVREWQRAFVLIGLVEVAFFGTGNIASLNSFNPTFLTNFISVFSPFTMAALLIVKIGIPFFQMGFAFAAVLHRERRLVTRLSVLLMIIMDSMALVFFFCLRDEGSWLDIGLSISNYVISMATPAIVFLLLHVASLVVLVDVGRLVAYFQAEPSSPDV